MGVRRTRDRYPTCEKYLTKNSNLSLCSLGLQEWLSDDFLGFGNITFYGRATMKELMGYSRGKSVDLTVSSSKLKNEASMNFDL